MTKRTEIIVETHRLLIIRRRGDSIRAWCEGCLAEVEMITPNKAAAVANVSSRTIYRWVEDAKLHFTESDGALHICPNSLPANHAAATTEPDQTIVKY